MCDLWHKSLEVLERVSICDVTHADETLRAAEQRMRGCGSALQLRRAVDLNSQGLAADLSVPHVKLDHA